MTDWPQKTFRCYKALFLFNLVFALSVVAGLVYAGAKTDDFLDFFAQINFFVLYIGFIPLSLFLGFCAKSYFVFQNGRKKGISTAVLRREIMNDPFLAQIYDGFLGYLAMMMLLIIFCAGKSLVAELGDYGWDPVFASMDKAFHGGRYPHEYLMGMMQGCGWIKLWEYIYQCYFVVLSGVMAYALFFEQDRRLRITILWAQCLCWAFLGIVMATLLTSAGPILYNVFHAPNEVYKDFISGHILPLGEACASRINLVRAVLLEWSTDDTVVNVNVASAMPSMHMSIMTVCVLYLWNKHIVARIGGAAFLALSLVSIVFFGFHYAIDGYISIALTCLIWLVARKIAHISCSEAAKKKGG